MYVGETPLEPSRLLDCVGESIYVHTGKTSFHTFLKTLLNCTYVYLPVNPIPHHSPLDRLVYHRMDRFPNLILFPI